MTSQALGLLILLEQRLTDENCVLPIDIQNLNGRPANWGNTFENGSNPAEVLLPLVRSWVVKAHNFTSFGVDSRHIRTLEVIAVVASQRQIGEHRLTVVFFGDDVVNLKRDQGVDRREMAILALTLSPLPDLLNEATLHCQPVLALSERRALD